MSLFTYYDKSETEIFEPVFKNPHSDQGRSILAEKARLQFTGVKHTEEHRAKNSVAQKEHLRKNPRTNYIYVTPMGEFTDATLAAEANGLTKDTVWWRCRYEKVAGFSRKKLDKHNESV